MKKEPNWDLGGVAGAMEWPLQSLALGLKPGPTCGDEGHTGRPVQAWFSHLQSDDWLTWKRPAVTAERGEVHTHAVLGPS